MAATEPDRLARAETPTAAGMRSDSRGGERLWPVARSLAVLGLWLLGFGVGLRAFPGEPPGSSGASAVSAARAGQPAPAGALDSSAVPTPQSTPPSGAGSGEEAGGSAAAYGPPVLAGPIAVTSAPEAPSSLPPDTAVPATTAMPVTTAAPVTRAVPATTASTVQGGGAGGAVERAVLDAVNAERAAAGCEPLAFDDRLTAAAAAHSGDMARQGYFSHAGRDGSTPADRARAAGYEGWTIGENIAAGYRSPEAVMEGWMSSPGHRANILNCRYEHLGVGYVANGNLWTQLFGAD